VTGTAVVAARPRIDRPGLVAGGALAVGVFVVAWLRHRNHWSGFDLAIFDQAAWQIAHGRDHISVVERHVMADHFSPVLYVFGLLYRAAATPAWFFAAQAIALGATVLPMRGVARHFDQPPARATYLVAASGPLLAAVLFDFHPSTLAVPFLAATLLYALQDRPLATTVAAIAVALCRADLALVLLAIALVAAPRARWRLVVVGGVAAAASAAVPGWFGETNGWAPHFGHLGSSPAQALLHPWDVAGQLLSGESLSIYLLWVVAAGVAIVLRPRWLVAVALAGLPVLLSRWEGTGLPWYHYGAPVAPLAIGGSLAGLATAATSPGRWAQRVRAAWWGGPALVLLLASPVSPLAPSSNQVWQVARGDDGRDVDEAVALVRDDDAVSADQRVLAQLSQREHAYLFPIPFAVPEEFFAEGAHPDLERYGDDAVDVVVATEGVEDLAPADRFEVVARLDGLVVLRRVEPDAEGG
jgi:uncharacterized membrane protein